MERRGDALMVHRPRDASGAFGSKSAADASREYAEVLSGITSYLREMEVPWNVIQAMQSTPSNEISLLSEATADSMAYVPTIEEWLMADCGSLTENQKLRMTQLKTFNTHYPIVLSASEMQELNALTAHDDRIRSCRANKLNDEKERLAREVPLRKKK